MKISRLLSLIALFLCSALHSPAADPSDTTYVRFNTNMGNIDVQMYTAEAPLTVQAFLGYVNSGAYTDSLFHRVIASFVIQVGGYTLAQPLPLPIPYSTTIPDESGRPNRMLNTTGTIAMALSTGPGSATTQWFFNVQDNPFLDDASDGGPFTVFGGIVNSNGLTIMDEISNLQTFDVLASDGATGEVTLENFPLFNYSSTTGSGSAVVVYSITELSSFSAWQNTNFAGKPANLTSPGATPENDGVTNLAKYVFNINPKQPMSTGDRANLPTAGTTTIGNTPYLTLTYHQNPALTGVNVGVETSTDLQTWTPVSNPTIVQVGIDSNTNAIMQVQVPTSGSRMFIRLSVTQVAGVSSPDL